MFGEKAVRMRLASRNADASGFEDRPASGGGATPPERRLPSFVAGKHAEIPIAPPATNDTMIVIQWTRP